MDYEISENKIFIKKGNFNIYSNIYIPAGFESLSFSGSTLSFSQNSTFVSESPIIALGTENKPIRFNSIGEDWAGNTPFQRKRFFQI